MYKTKKDGKASLAIAFNLHDCCFYNELACKNNLRIIVYLSGHSKHDVADSVQSYTYIEKVCTIDDFWGELKDSGYFNCTGSSALSLSSELFKCISNSSDLSSQLKSKLNAIRPKCTSQEIWPFLRAFFEIEVIFESIQFRRVLIRAHKYEKIIASGGESDFVYKILGYNSFHRVAALRLIKSKGLDFQQFPTSLVDSCRYQMGRKLLSRLIGFYKYTLFLKRKFSVIFNGPKKVLVPSKRLCFSQSPVHTSRFIEFFGKDDVPPYVLDYSPAVTASEVVDESEGWRLVIYRSFITGWNFLDKMPYSTSKIADSNPVMFLNIDITDELLDIVSQSFNRYPEYSNVCFAINEIISTVSPKEIFFGNDQVFSSVIASALACNQHIKTITLQHGWIAAPPVHNLPLNCDELFVFNTFTHACLIEYGAFPSAVRVDRSLLKASTLVEEKTQFSSNVKRVVLVSQAFKPYRLIAFKRFYDLAVKFPAVEFLIRLGPRDSLELSIPKLSNILIDRNSTPQEIFESASLMIGFNSTMLFEAMLVGKPLFVLDFPFESENPFLTSSNKLDANESWSNLFLEYQTSSDFRQKLFDEQAGLLSELR